MEMIEIYLIAINIWAIATTFKILSLQNRIERLETIGRDWKE